MIGESLDTRVQIIFNNPVNYRGLCFETILKFANGNRISHRQNFFAFVVERGDEEIFTNRIYFCLVWAVHFIYGDKITVVIKAKVSKSVVNPEISQANFSNPNF